METGEYKIGTNEDRNQTGKGSAVRIIKIKNTFEEDGEEYEENIFYAISSKNEKVYLVKEDEFISPDYGDKTIQEFKNNTSEKYQSYLGYDFGEVIPTNVVGYKELIEDFFDGEPSDEDMETGNLVFMGTEPDEDEPDVQGVRLCWALKREIKNGNKMQETLIEKNSFVRCMLVPMEQSKRMTVHYINNEGEKTSQAVNEMTEITDLKEQLYVMNN